MSKKKIVLYPIEVPNGMYCMEHKEPFTVCTHLNTEGGLPECEFGFPFLNDTEQGILKSAICVNLKKRQ